MFEYHATLLPVDTYTQIYAVVLLISVVWLRWRTPKLNTLALAVLLGWFGARFSTEMIAITPIVVLSVIGGLIAYDIKGTGARIIAVLYAMKLFWYSVTFPLNVPPIWVFEISTLMGWAQIFFLWWACDDGRTVKNAMGRIIQPARYVIYGAARVCIRMRNRFVAD